MTQSISFQSKDLVHHNILHGNHIPLTSRRVPETYWFLPAYSLAHCLLKPIQLNIYIDSFCFQVSKENYGRDVNEDEYLTYRVADSANEELKKRKLNVNFEWKLKILHLLIRITFPAFHLSARALIIFKLSFEYLYGCYFPINGMNG